MENAELLQPPPPVAPKETKEIDAGKLDAQCLERGLMTVVADMVPEGIPDRYARIVVQLAFSGLRDTARLTGEHESTVMKIRVRYKDLVDQIKIKKEVFIGAMILNLQFRCIIELEKRLEKLDNKDLLAALGAITRTQSTIQNKVSVLVASKDSQPIHGDKAIPKNEQDELAVFVNKVKQRAVMKQAGPEEQEAENNET